MPDIRHHVGIDAPTGQVYAAVATLDGLASWWTRDVRGDDRPGGRLAFGFGRPEPSAVMEVIERQPELLVRWRCVEGPQEWVGTSISFELREGDKETGLLFTHAGWSEPGTFLHHCSTKWALFLLGLKHGLEGGTATPWPNDPAISTWG